MSQGKVVLTVKASAGRRWMAVFSLGALGGLILWIAFGGSANIALQIILVLAAGVALWGASQLYTATAAELILTREGLWTSDGVELATVGNIDKVDRGAFAFKPSNGFLVRLKTPGPTGWAPGLWWRHGTFVGVGGVTPPGQTRAMAELLKAADSGELPDDM